MPFGERARGERCGAHAGAAMNGSAVTASRRSGSSTTVAVGSVGAPAGVMSNPSPAACHVTGTLLPSVRARVMSKPLCAVRCSGVPAAGQSYTDR